MKRTELYTEKTFPFLAIRRWADGGEQTVEYFETLDECLQYIKKQKQPKNKEFEWFVGEY